MRRLFLRNDWNGYPLRKDYDADEKINPIRLESESSPDATPTLELKKKGRSKKGKTLFSKMTNTS